MKNLPPLISIVGADGAGKTIVSKEVVDRINDRGYLAQRVDRWDIVGNIAYPSARFLKPDIIDIRSCIAEMPSPSRLLFLLWSMAMALTAKVHGDSKGDLVILDGYWMKHAASEIAYGLDPAWVGSVVEGIPGTDLVLYLRLEPDAAWQRKQGNLVPYECGMDESCSKESFLKHQGRIGAILDEWSKKSGWTEIDASVQLSSVLDMVVKETIDFMDRRQADLDRRHVPE
jgi:thymidylate kinase